MKYSLFIICFLTPSLSFSNSWIENQHMATQEYNTANLYGKMAAYKSALCHQGKGDKESCSRDINVLISQSSNHYEKFLRYKDEANNQYQGLKNACKICR